MKKEIKSVELFKEGIYYTLYINGESQGCGFLADMLEDLDSYIDSFLNETNRMLIREVKDNGLEKRN